MTPENNHGGVLADERRFPAYKIEILTRFMAGNGVNPELTLANTGLTQNVLSLQDTRTSIRQLATVFSNILRNSDDPSVALRAGQQIQISEYGMYGFALLTSASLRKTLEFAIAYHKLATPTTVLKLQEHDDHASFSFTDILGIDDLYRFNLEFQTSLVFSLFRDVLGSNFRVDEVHLRYPQPAHYLTYEKIFECPVKFEQPQTELQFPKGILDTPLPKSNAITEQLVREQCDALLAQQSSQSDLIREIISKLMQDPSNIPSSSEIASQLAMTSRTLRRKLEASGTSYRAIADDVRKELAIKYLRTTDMSIEHIADHVGFRDAANFRNAFKRWTNKSPGMYRP